MKRWLLILGLLGNVCSFAQNQAIIQGKVTDKAGNPIEYASIVIFKIGEEEASGGALSQVDGSFQLIIKDASSLYKLVITQLAYEPFSLTVGVSSHILEVKLEPAIQQLKEVVVKSERNPIVIRGDTTTFRVKGFRDGTERSIEDLLKKLPGVEVLENGIIRFKDKAVETVLLDDDNLMGQKYRMATRNLSADLVEEVQGIEHYQTNPLLRNVTSSESVVLNLKLKQAKTQLFGSIAAGFGTGSRGDLTSNAFMYKKLFKVYSILNVNNVGYSIQPVDNSLEMLLRSETFSERSIAPLTEQLLQTNDIISSILPKQRYTLNQDKALSFNNIVRVSPKIKLLPQFFFISSASKQQIQNRLEYIGLEQPFSVAQLNKLVKEQIQLGGKNDTEIIINSKVRLDIKSDVTIQGTNVVNDWEQQADNQFKTLNLTQKDKFVKIFNKLEFTHLYTQNWARQYTFIINSQSLPEHLTIRSTSPLFKDLIAFNSDSLSQTLNNPSLQILGTIKWLGRKKKTDWVIETGGNYTHHLLYSDITNKQQTDLLQPTFKKNDYRVTRQGIFFYLQLTKQLGPLHLNFETTGKLITSLLYSQTSKSITDKPRLLYNPIIKLDYRLNRYLLWQTNYEVDRFVNMANRMNSAFYITDYRTLQLGLDGFRTFVKHRFSLGLFYNNDFSTVSASLRISGFYSPNTIGSGSVLSPEYDLLITSIVPATSQKQILVSLGKYIGGLHGTLRMNTNFRQQDYTSWTGKLKTERQTILSGWQITSYYTSAFKHSLNFGLEASAVKSIIQFNSANYNNSLQRWNYKFGSNIRFNYKNSSSLTSITIYKFNNQSFNFIDFTLKRNVPKKRLFIEAVGKNLLGVDKFEQFTTNEQTASTVNFQLLKPYVMLRINKDF